MMHSKLHVKTFAELLSYSYVPKTGKLIFGKKVLPKMGHATIPGVGGFMSQKTGKFISGKKVLPKMGHATEGFRPKSPKMDQT